MSNIESSLRNIVNALRQYGTFPRGVLSALHDAEEALRTAGAPAHSQPVAASCGWPGCPHGSECVHAMRRGVAGTSNHGEGGKNG